MRKIRSIVLLTAALVILSLSTISCSNNIGKTVGVNNPISVEPTLLDSHLAFKGYGGKRIYGDQLAAQVFTASGSWDVQSIRLRVWIEGAVNDAKISVVKVENGQFNNVLNSQLINPADLVIGDPGSWIEVPLSSTLIAGQKYAILLSMGEGNEFNTIRWFYDTGGTGGTYHSDDGGTTWYQVIDRDFLFEVRGTN